jgi:hypothetical protein
MPSPSPVPGRILGHDFWKHTLAADPSVVNSTIWINGVDFTVVGIVQPTFTGIDESVPAFFGR